MTTAIPASALADVLYSLTRSAPVPVPDPQRYQWATIDAGSDPASGAAGAAIPAGPHWLGPVVQALLDRALAEPESATSTAELVVSKLDLDKFVDDLCRAPATWPVPLPLPGTAHWWPDHCLPGGALPPTDLLVAAAHLQHATNRLDAGHQLHENLTAAADRLYDAGLARLAERAKHQAKHQSATSGLQPTQIILAKHQ